VKIYTRKGDGGETGLFDGTRVPKSDPRVDAYGDVDELNSVLGAARAFAQEGEVKALLEGRSFRLVETMAEGAAQKVLKRFRLAEVQVRIRKFSVPGARSVGVEITRGRSRTTWGSPRTGPRSPESPGFWHTQR